MHALIENSVITALRVAPAGGAWEDGAWLDFTDPTVLSEWEARHGWTPVTLTPRPEDTETVKHDEKIELVDGVPTQQWKARPWNTAEVAERTAREARIADREARIADREAIKALFTRLQATITEAKDLRTAVQDALAVTAPTNVAGMWKLHNDALVLLRRLSAVNIDLAQDARAIAKVLKDD